MAHAFARPDGGISVLTIAPGVNPATEAERVANLHGWQHLGDIPVPTSRRFRNQWRAAAGAVDVDLPLAREQIVTEVRAERDKHLGASDGVYLKAQERGTEKEERDIASYRQALRDLPAVVSPALDAITTADELEGFVAAWPTKV